MLDTRAEIQRLLRHFQFRSGRALAKSLACTALAWLVVYWPPLPDITLSARVSLGIVTLAAALWITEAIPAFAVALLVIGLQIIVLGQPGGLLFTADDRSAWEAYVRPWASPPMWLFLGGLILARAAERASIDKSIAGAALRLTKGRPRRLLPMLMGVTFVFSMFMSNTATCAMMLTVLSPALARLPTDSPVARSLLLGVAFSASLGGMATIIGSPPNAIAAGVLDGHGGISFQHWMLLGLPPAILLAVLLWFWLSRPLAGFSSPLELDLPARNASAHGLEDGLARWQRYLTLTILVATILLWMSGSLHGVPTAVISFFPIVTLSMIGVIRAQDIRGLNWEVLLLLAGGLSLGVGIETSGLADWMGRQLNAISLPSWLLVFTISAVAALVSNLMSNTAAANILLPVGLAAALGDATHSPASLLVPVALSCSLAMALPISTPPNALVYASGRLQTRDFLPGGLLTLLLGPALSTAWCLLIR